MAQKFTRFNLFFGVFFLIGLHSCDNNSDGTNIDRKILKAEKPLPDSAKVLEEFEMFRSKRYEEIDTAIQENPEEVYRMVLWGKSLTQIPEEIGKFVYLHSLDVGYNKLTTLPEALSQLHYLQGLYASSNELTTFPDQILLLPLLYKLDLSENRISEVPREIKKMDQLSRLDMGKNLLTTLPEELYELDNLEVLYLDNNSIAAISSEVSNLRRLKKLDLSGNQLERIPPHIIQLKDSLTDLRIQGNPIPMEEIKALMEAMPGTEIRF